VVYPIIYKVLYIPGGARFQPSTIVDSEKEVLDVFVQFPNPRLLGPPNQQGISED